MTFIDNEYHSCYDELLTYLFNNSSNDILKVSDSLTAHEIIIYSLLLHKCIEEHSEESATSYLEIQKLRKKRCGKTKILDDLTLNAYDKAIYGLANKIINYNLGDRRKKYKITYKEHNHPLLKLYAATIEPNGNRIINYSLGPFGKMLIESKRYSTLVPNKYFQLNFSETATYQIALYICRIIYIERRKKKNFTTISLKSILSNTNKFNKCNNELIGKSNCYEYKGPNKKRICTNIIKKTNEILETLLQEEKITHYEFKIINNCSKWLINYNN